MGGNGKLGCIAKNLGQPIIGQNLGSGFFNSTPMPDFYSVPPVEPSNNEELQNSIPYNGDAPEPVGDGWREERNYEPDAQYTTELGWHFDGLNRGFHFEIIYHTERKELTAFYKGFMVYKESSGELMGYHPFPEWESRIENLYVMAKEKEKYKYKESRVEVTKEADRQKTNWLHRMRERWGL
jgi:hypothetical protein